MSKKAPKRAFFAKPIWRRVEENAQFDKGFRLWAHAMGGKQSCSDKRMRMRLQEMVGITIT